MRGVGGGGEGMIYEVVGDIRLLMRGFRVFMLIFSV